MCCIYVYMHKYMGGNTGSYNCVVLFLIFEAIMFNSIYTYVHRETHRYTRGMQCTLLNSKLCAVLN